MFKNTKGNWLVEVFSYYRFFNICKSINNFILLFTLSWFELGITL